MQTFNLCKYSCQYSAFTNFLNFIAASEILKILPHPALECVQYAEKINQAALEGNLIKHNKAVFYRLDLAKAIAYFQTKNVRRIYSTIYYNFMSNLCKLLTYVLFLICSTKKA